MLYHYLVSFDLQVTVLVRWGPRPAIINLCIGCLSSKSAAAAVREPKTGYQKLHPGPGWPGPFGDGWGLELEPLEPGILNHWSQCLVLLPRQTMWTDVGGGCVLCCVCAVGMRI